MPRVRSREGEGGTRTIAPWPSKSSALPNRPRARAAPKIVPTLPWPEASRASAPENRIEAVGRHETARGMDARGHVAPDLAPGEGAVVDAHLVDAAEEMLSVRLVCHRSTTGCG
jgi:hypothetical protein